MTPKGHVCTSGAVSIVYGIWVQSIAAGVMCFLGGLLIDLDHVLDYVLHYKKMCWRLSDLEDYCFNLHESKTYLILHSYELMLVLWGFVLYLNASLIGTSILIGMSAHIIFDQIANNTHPFAYFWFYRKNRGFPRSLFHYQHASAKENHEK